MQCNEHLEKLSNFFARRVPGNRSAGLRHGVTPRVILERAVPEAGAPICGSRARRAVVTVKGVTDSHRADDEIMAPLRTAIVQLARRPRGLVAKRVECVQLAGAVVQGWAIGKREHPSSVAVLRRVEAPRTPNASRDSVAAFARRVASLR